MSRITAVLIVLVLYALHQDVWFWRDARPLVFGFMPIGLFYHVAYTVALSFAFWALVRLIWPSHLDSDTATPDVRGPHRGSRGGVQ